MIIIMLIDRGDAKMRNAWTPAIVMGIAGSTSVPSIE